MRAQLMMPDNQFGMALLALLSCVILLVIAQLVFNKFEKKIPERL
jgi:ABC-type polysaccharide/polyol phosphate export permease